MKDYKIQIIIEEKEYNLSYLVKIEDDEIVDKIFIDSELLRSSWSDKSLVDIKDTEYSEGYLKTLVKEEKERKKNGN